ncbi:hypothetical protein BC937DRAFT_88941 [Endogone sp. FLAS-F59071]|nr:hypothetical protein BC937DRAFT_88941 [Endogone sp. FLAS-F59071]|eukprot:RUS18303.1 hypothetical protein BC937DRAFT_88941 [Endogone sp. FLAS-F59071]
MDSTVDLHIVADTEPAETVVNEQETQLCGICQKQFAKYTCPRCNLKYCSLACYKDETHVSCTESFYKDSIVEEIKSRQVDESEKRRMFEILRKFEKESAEQADELEEQESEEDESHDFAQRFENLDIDASSFYDIWAKLTPQEQAEFQRKVLKGEAPFTMASDELGELVPIWRPWWELEVEERKVFRRIIAEVDDNGNSDMGREAHEKGARPAIMENVKPLKEMTKNTPNPGVVFNLINVLFSYALACRRSNGDPFDDLAEACVVVEHISMTILFSREPFMYESIAEAVADCVQRTLEHAYSSDPPALSLILLQDLTRLLSTPTVAFSALSDLIRLLRAASTSTSVPKQTRRKAFLAEKKACFYLAYVRYICECGDGLDFLRSAVQGELERRKTEKREYEMERKRMEEALGGRRTGGSLVEELG